MCRTHPHSHTLQHNTARHCAAANHTRLHCITHMPNVVQQPPTLAYSAAQHCPAECSSHPHTSGLQQNIARQCAAATHTRLHCYTYLHNIVQEPPTLACTATLICLDMSSSHPHSPTMQHNTALQSAARTHTRQHRSRTLPDSVQQRPALAYTGTLNCPVVCSSNPHSPSLLHLSAQQCARVTNTRLHCSTTLPGSV